MKIRIAPSLLACDFSALDRELARAEKAGADWHHVDVMDGHFVPNLTFGPPLVEAMKKHANIPLDVHLMIEEPGKWAQNYADAGADILTFHYEAAAEDFETTLAAFRATGKKVGVAVNPPCGVEPLKPYLDQVDMVLIMSVHAGFGGQNFITESLDKVRTLRDWGWQGDVEMDGGVNAKTGALCREAGANVLVAGSYLFGAEDMEHALSALRPGVPAN